MSEQELKLNVPTHAQRRVEQALQRAKFTIIHLRAFYFDTPSRALVRARIALRLRLEGNQWVQTLKMPGEHSLSRIECNHERPDATLDLNVYAGTPAGEVLFALTEPLQICYETDVHRQCRDIRAKQGIVELAYDRGWLRAGSLQLPISEVEFELKRGQLDAIFEVGRTWQQKFELILDFRSKAERGDQLAQLAHALDASPTSDTRARLIADFWKPRSAGTICLKSAVKQRDPSRVLAAVTQECLEQIVRNTAVLCEVDTAGIYQASTPEHIHQLRVGIRRLRSAWSFFDGLTALPALEHRARIKQYFSLLGGTRDEDVLKGSLLPELSTAGLPALALPQTPHQSSSAQRVASTDFQGWLLDTLAHCTLTAATDDTTLITPRFLPALSQSTGEFAADIVFPRAPLLPKKPAVKPLLIKKLKKWHKQVLAGGVRFKTLEVDAQHRLRKRAKRLRYMLQFCEQFLHEKNLQRYKKQLSVVQEILGEMNDLYVAQPLFEQLKNEQPHAWFACGWIKARLGILTHQAEQAFDHLSATTTPWQD